jgi:hypothetical protein
VEARISEEKHLSHPEVSVRVVEAWHKNGPRKSVAMPPDEAEHLAAEVLKLREALETLYGCMTFSKSTRPYGTQKSIATKQRPLCALRTRQQQRGTGQVRREKPHRGRLRQGRANSRLM